MQRVICNGNFQPSHSVISASCSDFEETERLPSLKEKTEWESEERAHGEMAACQERKPSRAHGSVVYWFSCKVKALWRVGEFIVLGFFKFNFF